MPHAGTRVKMLGQVVTVYRNGVLWRNPHTGRREHLGVSRAEALVSLQAILEREPEPRAVRRADLAFLSDDLYRAHMRAYYYATARAKRAGHAIMERIEFESMVKRAAGRCEVTGIEFSTDRPRHRSKALWGPSLDRVSSRGPYTYANCRLVCTAVNLALNEFGLDTLRVIAAALSARSGGS